MKEYCDAYRNFVKGKKHGYGIFIYAKGNSYRGEWLVDKKCGKGVFMHSSGNVYDGRHQCAVVLY